jgi:hypothetical protein
MRLISRFSLVLGCALLLAACGAPLSSSLAVVQEGMPGSDVKTSAQEAAADGGGLKSEPEQKEPPDGDQSEPEGQPVIIEKLAGIPADCPVTLPGDKLFSPPPPYPAEFPYPGSFWYGSEKLWLDLPEDGTWGQLQHGDKVFVWRVGFYGALENKPALTLTGRRLDGPAPEARSDPPATNAYHEDFHWAMLHGFQVPTRGCWEITASYAEDTLTFVAWVP